MAFGASTLTSFSGAASDLFAAQGYEYKARGAEFERQNYLLAADLADQNAAFTETSTVVKEAQADRQIMQARGKTESQVAGAGFAASGSALDILRDSAREGALNKAVLSQQGAITEEGYKEQGESYRNMASAAQVAIDAAHSAEIGADITGAFKAIAGFATLAI